MERQLRRLYKWNQAMSGTNRFWKAFGRIVNGDPELTSIIQERLVLFQSSHHQSFAVEQDYKLALERLVEELHVDNVLIQYLKANAVQIVDIVDRALRRLYERNQPITPMNMFWKTFGAIVNNDAELVDVIRKHPLLLQQTQAQYESKLTKTVLEVLVEEVPAIQITLGDNQLRIEYLLRRLQRDKEEIENSDLFWTQIGFVIDNQSDDAIARIVSHSLLLQQSQYRPQAEKRYKLVLERLVEELQLKNVLLRHLNIDTEQNLDRQLRRLYERDQVISDSNIFWKTFGDIINNDQELIILIKKHELFMAKTKYQNKIVLQRLFEELDVDHFADEYCKHQVLLITNNLYITDSGTIALNEECDAIIDELQILLQWLFTTNTDTNKDGYSFDDAQSFNLPIAAHADNIQNVINIYAKPRNGSFSWTHVKALAVMERELKSEKPLDIVKTINVGVLDEEYGENGRIHISCNSEIVISKTAQINANECGMNKDMSLFYHEKKKEKRPKKENDKQILKYGTFAASSSEEKVDSENVGNERGGGVIELISRSNIVNNGILTSNATNEEYLGGTICIKTSKCFINNGQILATPRGQIIIKCASFVNNGTIAPQPIVLQASDMGMDWNFGVVHPSFTRAFSDLDKIKLTVYQHHGHYGDRFKPDNLLDGSNDTYYASVEGKTPGDWITF
eukprot:121015_1